MRYVFANLLVASLVPLGYGQETSARRDCTNADPLDAHVVIGGRNGGVTALANQRARISMIDDYLEGPTGVRSYLM
jgi:hypothetical protein